MKQRNWNAFLAVFIAAVVILGSVFTYNSAITHGDAETIATALPNTVVLAMVLSIIGIFIYATVTHTFGHPFDDDDDHP